MRIQPNKESMVKGHMPKVRLAIFDIDGTIFRSSLLIELVSGLIAAGILPKKSYEAIEKKKIAWLDHDGRYDDYLREVIEIHNRDIKGCRFDDVVAVAHSVIDEQKKRTYRFTRDLAKDLKKRGYHLVAISGSPAYIVSEFAQHLGFDASIGRILEVKNNRFTGKILNQHIVDKRKIVTEFISAQPFAVDLIK